MPQKKTPPKKKRLYDSFLKATAHKMPKTKQQKTAAMRQAADQKAAAAEQAARAAALVKKKHAAFLERIAKQDIMPLVNILTSLAPAHGRVFRAETTQDKENGTFEIGVDYGLFIRSKRSSTKDQKLHLTFYVQEDGRSVSCDVVEPKPESWRKPVPKTFTRMDDIYEALGKWTADVAPGRLLEIEGLLQKREAVLAQPAAAHDDIIVRAAPVRFKPKRAPSP